MSSSLIPFERYPGLSPLFHDFLCGLPEYYPDRPTLEAAAARGRDRLGQAARLPASAFRYRESAAASMAEDLARGRAVAVVAGHQVGLFTGPLFTLLKAFDAIRVARQLRGRGVPAVPVFYALTDDHDLEEVARTARPGPDGPQILVLEGADRSNRGPVGTRPIPEGISQIIEAFRSDARTPEAHEILERFARRSAPGVPYGKAFIETLFDLVAPEPLLVLDPLEPHTRGQAAELFRLAAEKEAAIRATLRRTQERLQSEGRPVPVPFRPSVFPFFSIEKGERRRVALVSPMLEALSRGDASASVDVLTRPLFKSFILPVAASILGAAEIAYHAQALPLFPVFGLPFPVLLPRSHLVLLGPAERRAAEALGVERQNLLDDRQAQAPTSVPPVARLESIAHEMEQNLTSLELELRALDPTLVGALETARTKVTYQITQLGQRIRKAAERRDAITSNRRRRLETMVRPGATAAERLYPPLVPLLAHGREALDKMREGATGELRGAVVLDLGTTAEAAMEEEHGG